MKCTGRFQSIGLVCLLVWAVVGCRSPKPPPEPPPTITEAERTARDAAALVEAGNWQAAARQWQLAAEQFQLLNDRRSQAVALHNLGQARRALQDYPAARRAFNQALGINAKEGERLEWWGNQLGLIQTEAQSGDTNAVNKRFNELRPMLGEIADARVRALFLNELGLWQLRQGELGEAAESLRTAGEVFARLNDRPGAAAVLANQGLLFEAQKNFPAALDAWYAALGRFEALGDRNGIARALMGTGRSRLLARQDLSEAEDALRRAMQNFELLGLKTEAQQARRLLQEVQQAEGKSATP